MLNKLNSGMRLDILCDMISKTYNAMKQKLIENTPAKDKGIYYKKIEDIL